MADSATPTPNVKPGWQTTQFWLVVGASVAIALLTEFSKVADTVGLPPWAILLWHMGGPTLIAALIGWYSKHRTSVYNVATIAAANAEAGVATTVDADKVLNSKP